MLYLLKTSILQRSDQIDFMHTKNGSYHMLIDYLNINFNIFASESIAAVALSMYATFFFALSLYLFFAFHFNIMNFFISNRYGKNIKINCIYAEYRLILHSDVIDHNYDILFVPGCCINKREAISHCVAMPLFQLNSIEFKCIKQCIY